MIDLFLREAGIKAVLLNFEVASDGVLIIAVADFNGEGRGGSGRSLDPISRFTSEKETPFLANRRPRLGALTIARRRRCAVGVAIVAGVAIITTVTRSCDVILI